MTTKILSDAIARAGIGSCFVYGGEVKGLAIAIGAVHPTVALPLNNEHGINLLSVLDEVGANSRGQGIFAFAFLAKIDLALESAHILISYIHVVVGVIGFDEDKAVEFVLEEFDPVFNSLVKIGNEVHCGLLSHRGVDYFITI